MNNSCRSILSINGSWQEKEKHITEGRRLSHFCDSIAHCFEKAFMEDRNSDLGTEI
jgi:hypothetical protein